MSCNVKISELSINCQRFFSYLFARGRHRTLTVLLDCCFSIGIIHRQSMYTCHVYIILHSFLTTLINIGCFFAARCSDAVHSAVYAVVRCPSVRQSVCHFRVLYRNKEIILKLFTMWLTHHSGFSVQNAMVIFRQGPPIGGIECRQRIIKNPDFRPISCFI